MHTLSRSAALPAQAGYTGKVQLGMDVAASEFYTQRKNGEGTCYDLNFKVSLGAALLFLLLPWLHARGMHIALHTNRLRTTMAPSS